MSTYVPRKDDENGSDRDLADEALETLLGLAVGILKGLVTNLEEVFTTLNGCGDFARCVGNGATHLHSQFLTKLILLGQETVEELANNGLTLLQRCLAVVLESLSGDLGKRLKVSSRGAIPGEDGLVCVWGDCGDCFNRHIDVYVCEVLK
ncbi:unnamed protein product [Fusarium graminearum]|nr:unnamed protein product [Fusarium graminearum]CAG1988939.1 unnamed protein product [Fusarium graminearum]VTO89584.1 unnamed protein product [Fusarium graminearum]